VLFTGNVYVAGVDGSGKAARQMSAEEDTWIVDAVVEERLPAAMRPPTVDKKRDELIVIQKRLGSSRYWYTSQLNALPSAGSQCDGCQSE
jgi:hypothetical protein